MTLYQINNTLREVIENGFKIDYETGEIIEYNTEELDALQAERDNKIEATGLVIKELTAEAKAVKEEADNLIKRAKTLNKRAEWLTGYLAAQLNGEKFSTPKVLITFRESESVNVTDLASVPQEFLRYKEPEPNKTEIKKALKAGKEISGCELVKNVNMSIK